MKAPLENFGLAAWSGRPAVMGAPHRHHDLELNYLPRGWLDYFVAGRRVRLEARRLALFWGAVPHRLVDASADARLIWITLPLPNLLRWQLPKGLTEALLGGSLVEHALSSDPACLPRWVEEIAAPQYQASVLKELEARILRAALDSGPPAPRQPPQSGRAAAMAAFLAERYREPVTARDAAAAAGLNPNYAATLFARQFGMTPTDYLTALRVAHAQRLLATGDKNILDIAHESGFASPSRFYAAFRQVAQTSPRAFRRRLR